MPKVNDQIQYDPDFGKGFYPDCDAVYVVNVIRTIGENKKKKWKFYLLLPRISDEEEETSVVQYACDSLLEAGDQVKVTAVSVDEYDSIEKSTPIAMFDPTTMKDFFWLVPPKYLMN